MERPNPPNIFGHSLYVISGEIGNPLKKCSRSMSNSRALFIQELALVIYRAEFVFYVKMELGEAAIDDKIFAGANELITSLGLRVLRKTELLVKGFPAVPLVGDALPGSRGCICRRRGICAAHRLYIRSSYL